MWESATRATVSELERKTPTCRYCVRNKRNAPGTWQGPEGWKPVAPGYVSPPMLSGILGVSGFLTDERKTVEQILWAVKAAPVADVNEWAVLVAMAEAADQDGSNSFLSVTTISRRTRLAERTVQRRIGTLEERGLLRRGDQTSARMIPADRRPVVYDLQVPYSFFRPEKSYAGADVELSVNIWRAGRGRPPLTAQDRPDLTAAPEKGQRADRGVKRRQADGVTTSHPVDQDGVTTSHPRGDYESPHGVTTSHPTLPNNPPHNPPRSAARSAATADTVETSSSSITSGNASDRDDAAAAATATSTTRASATRGTTPAAILEAAGLDTAAAGRFRAWLVTGTGATNPDGLIVTLRNTGRLPERLSQWRASEDPTQVPGPPRAGHLAWCGDCDRATRTAVARDAEGRDYVRRCPACNINASTTTAPSTAAHGPAAAASDDTARDAYEAARAARAALPAGVRRRTTTIGNVVDIATVRDAQRSAQ